MLRSTWRGLETWHGRDSGTLADERARQQGTKLRPKPARQSSTLPMRGEWKRSHGRATKAPPDERGGNRHARPTAAAPLPHSTQPCRSIVPPVMTALGQRTNPLSREGGVE